MKKTMLILILLCLPFAIAQQTLFISVTFEKEDLGIKSYDVELFHSENYISQYHEGDYLALLISAEEEILYNTSFSLDLFIEYSKPPTLVNDEGEIVNVGESYDEEMLDSPVAVFFPYYYNVDRIEVYKDDILIHTVDLTGIAKCNNDYFCDENEFFETCPEDCVFDEEQPDYTPAIIKTVLSIVGAFLVLILLKIMMKKRKKNKTVKKKEIKKTPESNKKSSMKCPNCGASISKDSLGCTKCGHEL